MIESFVHGDLCHSEAADANSLNYDSSTNVCICGLSDVC